MPGRPADGGCHVAHLGPGHGTNQNPCKCRCEKVRLGDHQRDPYTNSDALMVAAVAVINAQKLNACLRPPCHRHYTVLPCLEQVFAGATRFRGGQPFVSSHLTQVVL